MMDGVRVKTTGVELGITGPTDSGEYWLHLKSGETACGINLGVPMGMTSTALLMAASVDFSRRSKPEAQP